MKVMSSKEAQNGFGQFLDTVQQGPVMVTRRNRPVGVMIPMDNLPAIFDLARSMEESIMAGVQAGLNDSETGKGAELNQDYVNNLKSELQTRINNNRYEKL